VLVAEFLFGGLVACFIIPFAVGEVGANVFHGAIFFMFGLSELDSISCSDQESSGEE